MISRWWPQFQKVGRECVGSAAHRWRWQDKQVAPGRSYYRKSAGSEKDERNTSWWADFRLMSLAVTGLSGLLAGCSFTITHTHARPHVRSLYTHTGHR